MDAWAPLALNELGRPQLLPDEIECIIRPAVGLYLRDDRVNGLQEGECTLTSHRLLWTATGGGPSLALPLVGVLETTSEHGFVKRSPKIRIQYHPGVDGAPRHFKLSFRGGGRDEFFALLETMVARKAWTVTPAAAGAGRGERVASVEGGGEEASFTTSGAGIAGILRRQEADRRSEALLADSAFSDLEALMASAKEVVSVIERHVATEGRAEGKAGEDDLLLDMGITSPVTKESAGALYHRELSRQLCGFLQPPLAAAGGTMTLSDVYCLFNRARGTELISPDDLLKAAQLFEALQLPLRLHKFDTGVMVIRAASQSDEAVAERLLALPQTAESGVTAYQVSQLLNVSLLLAEENLRSAEALGKLCRDETVECVRFYPNLFLQTV